jgi:carboxyl-terminal processing protease
MVNRKLVVVFIAAALTLSACDIRSLASNSRTVARPTVPPDASFEKQAAIRDFDQTVNSLRALYLDRDAVGTAWQQAADAERVKLIASDEPDASATALRTVIDLLNDPDISIQAGAPTASAFGGIGVLADAPDTGKDRVLIMAVYPDSPAERAGIEPHDAIVAINGTPVRGEEGLAAMVNIRGEPDTIVKLTVRTPGQADREVEVTRQIVRDTPQISYRRMPGTDVAYIRPAPSADRFESMRDDVSEALRDLTRSQALTGIILDLRAIRGNTFPLDDMLSLFVNGDRIAQVRTRSNSQGGTFLTRNAANTPVNIRGKGVGGSQTVRMVILVSDLTSGQAEAFAGALQELGRAQVMGPKTSGRTVVMDRVQLPASGLLLELPVGEYLGSRGTSWYKIGVTPGTLLEQKFGDYSQASDPVVPAAVELVLR